MPPGDLIAGFQKLITQARARGVRIAIGTIFPSAFYLLDARKDVTRQAVNQWLRTSAGTPGGPDAVLDFDKAIAVPFSPLYPQPTIDPRYNFGDLNHLNYRGSAVLGRIACEALAPSTGCQG
jgi:hypothetical protein